MSGLCENKVSRLYYTENPEIEYKDGVGLVIDRIAILLYVDGACRRNGTPEVSASIGIYAGPGHPMTIGKNLPANMKLTNQTAELMALIFGIEARIIMVRKTKFSQLVMASDSAYACEGITTWVDNWRRSDFENIQNGMLFRQLDQMIEKAAKDDIVIKFWKTRWKDNTEADRQARRVLEPDEVKVTGDAREGDREGRVREQWRMWLEEPWYGEVAEFLLFGNLVTQSHLRLRKIRRESRKFRLVHETPPRMLYCEKNDVLAVCVRPTEVANILYRFHDNHGHFSIGIMSRNLVGRYYWPGRFSDVAKWCLSCDSCQRMGPLRNSTQVKPIMSLQPFDLMGMDFLGPISPASKSGAKYILLMVDYFSRYLFAQAVERATGAVVVDFLRRVSNVFGWPLAFYVDNGSHFVKGELPKLLKEVGTHLFTAPVSNPRSIGLTERYVQLVLAGLRVRVAAVASNPTSEVGMDKWEEHLDHVVQAINTRVLKVHGYTPSQLLFRFNTRFHPLNQTLAEELRQSYIKEQIESGGNEFRRVSKEYDLRLAQIEEIRELAKERFLRHQEDRELSAAIPRYEMPQLDDLVLRRRFNVDKSLGMKLHTRWDGPYRLVRIAKPGVSGEIADLKTEAIIGRYAFESLKVFIPRERMGASVNQVSLAEGLGQEQLSRGCEVDLRKK